MAHIMINILYIRVKVMKIYQSISILERLDYIWAIFGCDRSS